MSEEKNTIKLGKLTLEKVKEISAGLDKTNEDHNAQINNIFDQSNLIKELELKIPRIADPNFLDIKAEQLSSMETNDLQKLLSGENHKGAIDPATLTLISNELLMRQIKESSKPHWTVTPTFIVGCIASILAAISILVTIYFSVFYNAVDNKKHTGQSYTIEKDSSPK